MKGGREGRRSGTGGVKGAGSKEGEKLGIWGGGKVVGQEGGKGRELRAGGKGEGSSDESEVVGDAKVWFVFGWGGRVSGRRRWVHG